MTQHSTHIEPEPAETNRRLTRLWRSGQWLGLCMIMVLGLLLAVREFKDWQILTSLTGPWHWVGQIVVRAVLALPVLGLLALLAHPVRARRWMLGLLRRGWGRLRVQIRPTSLHVPLERATTTLTSALVPLTDRSRISSALLPTLMLLAAAPTN